MNYKDKTAALEFLSKHLTIPSDHDMSDEDLDIYGELAEFLAEHPNDECIPLIVNSYRSHSSAYLAEVFAKVLAEQNQKVLNQHIIAALKSEDIGQRESGLFFAVEFASDDFVRPLTEILRDGKSGDKIVNDAVSVLEAVRTADTNLNIEEIIEKEFRQSSRWKHISELRNGIEFQSLIRSINWEARKALEKKDYRKVTELLGPYDGELPKSAQKKLDIAKMNITEK
ncbi:MAG: hypothetical protein DRI57_15125 [Deltaproteobacteria bacterium]|nr:MAG: hypothetical protein DRI57_15125 [Deltaproteobacteria bacterium]